jgi:hypothetical protein
MNLSSCLSPHILGIPVQRRWKWGWETGLETGKDLFQLNECQVDEKRREIMRFSSSHLLSFQRINGERRSLAFRIIMPSGVTQ